MKEGINSTIKLLILNLLLLNTFVISAQDIASCGNQYCKAQQDNLNLAQRIVTANFNKCMQRNCGDCYKQSGCKSSQWCDCYGGKCKPTEMNPFLQCIQDQCMPCQSYTIWYVVVGVVTFFVGTTICYFCFKSIQRKRMMLQEQQQNQGQQNQRQQIQVPLQTVGYNQPQNNINNGQPPVYYNGNLSNNNMQMMQGVPVQQPQQQQMQQQIYYQNKKF